MHEPESLYEQERRQKLQKLRDLGVDPFGGRVDGVTPLTHVRAAHKPEFGQDGGPTFKAAGRVMLKRDMGKLSFMTIRDETGDLQVALDKKRLNDTAWEVRNLLDLGDQVVAEGPLGSTKTGEPTIWATSLQIASKSLLPPPAKWEGLSDVEARYRQRYVDLWANPEVMRTAKLRIRIVDEIRKYLKDRGFDEVETPMMQPIHGGAAARPFETHHKALDMKLYLRIAPELYLKRLLVGGFSKVFEINRNFRNEGISPRHNPEFTMLEAYEAFGSWETMADLVEGMICHVAETVFGTLRIEHRDAKAMAAVHTYSPQDPVSLVRVAQERLRLVSPTARPAAVRSATPEEVEAFATASEGFEEGQSGFDALLGAYRAELAGKGVVEQREILASKMTIREIDLTRPWRRVRMCDLVAERTGWQFNKEPLGADQTALLMQAFISKLLTTHEEYAYATGQPQLPRAEPAKLNTLTPQVYLEQLGAETAKKLMQQWERFRDGVLQKTPAEQLTEVYEKLVEPRLVNPTFVTHVPSVIIPLARKAKDDPFFADVYELAINGQEISPGYSELNDPDVQAENFTHQVGDKEEQQKVDEDFLSALRYGMPPAGGMGLGIDRLVMMLTGAESIRDVILFPLMRPQG